MVGTEAVVATEAVVGTEAGAMAGVATETVDTEVGGIRRRR